MVSSRGRTPLEAWPPTGGVTSPHLRLATVGLVLAAACLAGCESSGANQVSQPIVLGMTDSVTPIFNTQQLTLYEVQVPVPLPVRMPTSQEESGLGGADPPYPHQPYLLDTDESLEVRFTISNLDNEQHAVYLLLDPWNEFVRYRPGVTFLNDEETLPNPSGFQKAFLVDGMSRVEGTVTTDDTTAMAIALATAMDILSQPANPMATYSPTTLVDNAFDLQNRPISNDPLVSPYIPSTIAGLTGFDLGLQSDSAENISIEIVYDVMDLNGNRLIPQGQSGTPIGIPTTILSPEVAGTGSGSGTGAGS
jgi:hypothetical protein